ncbi:MAG TPA: glycosyltransferase, partial [Pyrinomonadaceae bacterium]|nr:glycosyltransferase [Pyrinomonadaceae bacterium]
MSGRVDYSADLVLVCNSLDAGGIERVVSTLANEWSRRGRRVSVVMQYDRQRFYALDPSIHHVVLGNSGLARLLGFTKKIRSRLLESNPAKRWLLRLLGGGLYNSSAESFHRINFGLLIAFEAWALRRALKRIESPVVVSFGTALNILTVKACEGLGRRVVISERSAGLNGWGRLSRRFYNRADIVTANSRGTLRGLADFVDQGKLAFVPNPLVLPNGGGGGEPPPAPFFLSVGRLVWDKAYDVLLEAFALAGDELGAWRLSVVGDGMLKDSLAAQADGLGIAGRVDWHGVMRDPHAFYRAAGVFVLASRVEGMPNALL